MFNSKSRCSDDVAKIGVEAFKKTVTSELESRIHEKHGIVEQLKPVLAAEKALFKADTAARKAFEGLAPLVEAEKARFKAIKSALPLDNMRTLSLTTRGGLSVSIPPYDVQWTSSPFNQADMKQGTFKVTSIDSLGYQAAGIGLFVNSSLEEDVRFSADALFHSKWSDLVVEGAATTEGGVGVIVYEGGNLIARHDAKLWSDFQSGHTIHGQSGDDMTLLTQTTAGQTYFHMLPGRQYLVWIWAWTTAAILGNDLAVAQIEANVPFVVVQQTR